MDFFTVPTATFRVLLVWGVLTPHPRWALHFNGTEQPPAFWTGQPGIEAFPVDRAPRYRLRDHDKVCGADFRQRLPSPRREEVLSAPASTWPRAYVERGSGSLRRDCWDPVIVRGE